MSSNAVLQQLTWEQAIDAMAELDGLLAGGAEVDPFFTARTFDNLEAILIRASGAGKADLVPLPRPPAGVVLTGLEMPLSA